MIEPNSSTWLDVSAWAKRELEIAVNRLKNPTLPHDAKQVVCGEVKKLEELLELASPKPKPKIVAPPSYES